MRPRRPARKPARQRTMAIRRDAAGIDIGARRIHVAVDPERDARPVREFQTFTQDLYALADWLEACGVRTVAIAYASHCTSFGRCETFSSAARLFDNLTPLAFSGGSGPGSSYRYSSLSLQR